MGRVLKVADIRSLLARYAHALRLVIVNETALVFAVTGEGIRDSAAVAGNPTVAAPMCCVGPWGPKFDPLRI
jgi:hypothetical protein